MGDVFGNWTSPESLVNSSQTSYGCHSSEAGFTFFVAIITIACISLPLTILAIFLVYSLVQHNHVAPIYVINLLITDLLQVCCMIVLVAVSNDTVCDVFIYLLQISTMVSICFMVVVSLERYLSIAWPLWYRFRRSIKTSLIVCVVIWLLPLTYLPIYLFAGHFIETAVASFLLLPFPLLFFFLFGTVRALSSAISVPADEKRRIVATLVLVLLIYTLLFMPRIIFSLAKQYRNQPTFEFATIIPVFFSPLADLFLYVFMKKGISDRPLAALCCCKMDQDDVSQSNKNGETLGTDDPAQAEEEEAENKS